MAGQERQTYLSETNIIDIDDEVFETRSTKKRKARGSPRILSKLQIEDQGLTLGVIKSKAEELVKYAKTNRNVHTEVKRITREILQMAQMAVHKRIQKERILEELEKEYKEFREANSMEEEEKIRTERAVQTDRREIKKNMQNKKRILEITEEREDYESLTEIIDKD